VIQKILFLFLISSSTIYPIFSLESVYGIPPFPRFSHFDDYVVDQLDSGNATKFYNATKIYSMPIDISSVTYLSDGNNLNATIWLNYPILTERHKHYLESNLTYVMDIYSVDAREGFDRDILYSVVISPEEDGSWTKKIIEHSPGAYWPNLTSFTVDDVVGASRILKIYPNYTEFFQNNNTYVNIDVSLKDIGNPPDARVEFGAYIEERGNTIDDWTYLMAVPGRQSIHIFEWPESLEARAGQTVKGRVLIHNFELLTRGYITLQNANTSDYELVFNPNRIEYPRNGTISTEFEITINPHVVGGTNETLPLQVNVTPVTIENVTGSAWVETFNIRVLPPLSAADQTYILLIPWFGIYWIPFSATIAFGLWLSKRIDKRKLAQDIMEKSRSKEESKSKDSIEKLEPKDILTANASVVAGVLIFLTVGGTELFESQLIIHISILTASIVFPFAISAIRILTTNDPVTGIKFTIPGFVLLMISVVLITFVVTYQNPQIT
jgi:hypothetical protein